MGLDTHDYGILTEPMKIWYSQLSLVYILPKDSVRLEDNIIVQGGEPST
jgi:hypothetical protein